MRKNLLSFLMSVTVLLIAQQMMAQVATISGTVTDGESPLAGVNILIKGKVAGTITNLDGKFAIRVQDASNTTLVFSMVGFKNQEYTISGSQSDVTITLEESVIIGDEVVISASRVEENIMESPVTIEKMDIRDIRESPALSFYDAIGNIKGVDLSTQSLTFKSVNARGFSSNGNERFVQLIDGIDNQAPGLNFPVGNIVGISELDLESVELIPGASSALYGPNAINGILLMNSKSPFEYQGLSVAAKAGINHVDNRDADAAGFSSVAVRYAKSFNDKFAFKVNGSFLRARDFRAVDYRNQENNRPETDTGTRETSKSYDGVNVYGDPVLNLGTLADIQIRDPETSEADRASLLATRELLPDGKSGDFSPRGYTESEFVDNLAQSIKFNAAAHYRFNDALELIGQFNYGTGNSVYTGNDRYVFDGFYILTGKVELKGTNFFVRSYTTQENSGDSYASNGLASLINRETYIPAYLRTFIGARSSGADVSTSHDIARVEADKAYAKSGSNQFNQLYDSLRSLPIGKGGARFLDKTKLYQFEGMYNFSNQLNDDIEVIVGGNVRRYDLNSEGTLFALDNENNEYDINEWGAYVQAKKKLLNDDLTLSGSVRYDKNQYFKGQFSPRLSAVYNLADKHFIRVSGQRGFRMPVTQDQFIDLDLTTRWLVGSNEDLVDRYRFRENTVYTTQSLINAENVVNSGGDIADARELLQKVEIKEFDTEKINTAEIGYKGVINNKLFIDAYYYYSIYNDFITAIDFTQAVPNGLKEEGPANPESDAAKDDLINGNVITQRFGFDVNAERDVLVQGAAIGLDYQLPNGYTLGGNFSYNELLNESDLVEDGLQRNFNTPKYRANFKFANREVVKNLGFNLVYRWQEAYVWESAIGSAVVPAFGTVDGQISLKIKNAKSIVKLGGSNLLNKRYTTSFANPSLGAMYYIGITFDEFLN